MVLLVCPCLNVRIHGKNNINLEDPSKLNLPESLLVDTFFESNVYAVFLDLAGLTMSQKDLCKTRHNNDWVIVTCVCCDLDICAYSVKDNVRVLVSSKAEMNSNNISSLMSSERYSTLFKLVLPEINDNFIQNNFGNGFQDKNLDSSIEQVQFQVSNFLRNEQKLMEDRIRKFTEEQQAGYTRLLQIVRKNKQAMVYLMTKCKSELTSEVPSPNLPLQREQPSSFKDSELIKKEPMPTHTDSANESSTSTDSVFNKSDPFDPTSLIVRKSTHKSVHTLRRTVSNPGRPRSIVKRDRHRGSNITDRYINQGSIDVGGVFPMDVLEVAEHAQSLYSESDTGESEGEERSEDTTEEARADDAMYATSLPMSIPSFPQMSRSTIVENESEETIPDDIAASMRALACSVRDGTEMFGELPRRRLNTGELLAFRPS